MTRAATIREMTARDVARAADVLRRGDFGEREQFFAWAVERPTINVYMATVDDEIVATGVASVHGPVGWVGVIFVAPSWRRSGLGRRITRTVLDRLESAGCRSQVLIASPMGRPIYEREGFEVFDRQVRFTADGLPPDGPPDPRIRAYAPGDLDAVLALDRQATGEDRSAVLGAIVRPELTTVVVGDDGAVRGFLARTPWRGGAVIAPDPDDALRLLEGRRHGTGASGRAGAGVLASNERGRERLRAAGWQEELGGVRMLRGAPLDWHPDAIYGQLNGALG